LRELREWFVEVLEATNDVAKTGSGPEVLLLQTELFADCRTHVDKRMAIEDLMDDAAAPPSRG
jgi:hypothetical protein